MYCVHNPLWAWRTWPDGDEVSTSNNLAQTHRHPLFLGLTFIEVPKCISKLCQFTIKRRKPRSKCCLTFRIDSVFFSEKNQISVDEIEIELHLIEIFCHNHIFCLSAWILSLSLSLSLSLHLSIYFLYRYCHLNGSISLPVSSSVSLQYPFQLVWKPLFLSIEIWFRGFCCFRKNGRQVKGGDFSTFGPSFLRPIGPIYFSI